MKYIKPIILFFTFSSALLSAAELTMSSYNCGGLTDHYDYLRAVAMEKLMQERYLAEPKNMALNEKIQQVALKRLFSQNPEDQSTVNAEWERNGYENIFKHLTTSPMEANSPNTLWFQRMDEIITNYRVRPVSIFDNEVKERLNGHIADLIKKPGDSFISEIGNVRSVMAKRIFAYHLQNDIICLQEADYLNASLFPPNYEMVFSDSGRSKNGVAWNKDRFILDHVIGDILGRAYAVQLKDRESGKMIAVASGHITGCNPYRVEIDPQTGKADSLKGDKELQALIETLDGQGADLMIIGMDSNVTSLHPRLNILKDAGYVLDYENFLDSTCTSPYQVLNTRIDWIAFKANPGTSASITNIPVTSVGLNSMQTNMSDHKPITAKIEF